MLDEATKHLTNEEKRMLLDTDTNTNSTHANPNDLSI